jgi:diguanylate cyclase (GGDEF)-like protein
MSWRTWGLWALPREAVVLVVVVVTAALGLTVMAWVFTPVTRPSLTYFTVIVVLGLGAAEATRGVERLRRRFSDTPHVNLSSVWTLSAAVVTTPGLAAVTAAILYAHMWYRSWYRISGIHSHKIIYNASVVTLSCFAAAAVVRWLPAVVSLDLRRPASLVGMVVVIGAYSAVNSGLIGAVIAVSQGDRSLRRLAGSWRDNSLEYATLCVGMIAAVMLWWHPWLIVLVLLPLYVLHRSVLVRQLEHAATTDQKTGLLNATSWHSLATAEFERAHRHGTALSLLMADLDHFKRVNDVFGHLVGDEVLRAVADVIRQTAQADGLCGRFGGEEFVVVLPGVGMTDAVEVAHRIRRRVRSLTFGAVGIRDRVSDELGVSLSIGVATYPDAGRDVDEVLRAADNALFLAKDSGRDQVQTVQVSARHRHEPSNDAG